jgi:pimeloyl-ACP methyl ester carboxylesterase
MNAHFRPLVFTVLLLFSFLLFSCSDSGVGKDNEPESDSDTTLVFDPGADDDDYEWTDDDQPADDDDDNWPEIIDVIGEYLSIEGEPAPPNPVTGLETPPEFNRIQFYRFREKTNGSARPISKVLILIPGFTVGANSIMYAAKSLVELADGDLEVWVPDHRHHLLEDQWGMDVAEHLRNPNIAIDYYFRNRPILGKTYSGFLKGKEPATDMMSEWGLDIVMKDLRRLIHLIPEENRATSVFLGGHSRGVAFARAFAANEFSDGILGSEEIAGLVFIDGVTRYQPWKSQSSIEKDLNYLRDGSSSRFVALPLLGPSLYVFTEILGMAASRDFAIPGNTELGPDGIFPNKGPFALLTPIAFRGRNITMTNEAFTGFLADNESGLVGIVRAGLGRLDGPTNRDFLGVYPTDENRTYTWVGYDETDPAEPTDIQDLIPTIYKGPSNVVDRYYSSRLNLDLIIADQGETAGTWREEYFRMYTSQIDAPVIAIVTRIIAGTDRSEQYRNKLAPVRGQDLPRDEFGYEIIRRPDWDHVDPIYAKAENNEFFHRLIEWMDEFSSGEICAPQMRSFDNAASAAFFHE